MKASRASLKSKEWQEGNFCYACGKLATDLDECFIPKSAVMQAPQEKRLAINIIYNTAPLCNQCNTNVTHEKRITERRMKLLHTGLAAVADWGFHPGDFDDDELMMIGAQITQAWVDAMRMKTRYSILDMAELK